MKILLLAILLSSCTRAFHPGTNIPAKPNRNFKPDIAIPVTLLSIEWKDQPLSKIVVADSTGRTYDYILKSQYNRAHYFIGHKYLLYLDSTRCTCEAGSYITAQLKYYRRK